MPEKVVDGVIKGTTIAVSSGLWRQFLMSEKSFRYESHEHGGYTASRQNDYWYASRKHQGKLFRKYIGTTEQLNIELLDAAAIALEEMIVENPVQVIKQVHEVKPKELSEIKNELQRLQKENAFIQQRLNIIEGKLAA